MKPILIFLLFILACNTNDKKEISSMAGVYQMISQNIKNEKTDTTYTTLKQLKIFTEDYMMYANFNPADSVGSFGIGSYTLHRDSVIEDVFYNATDSTYNNDPGKYTLIISKTPKGYKQVIPSIQSQGQTYVLTEEYESIGTQNKNAIDGTWRQVKTYWIKGTDTITNTPTQYKVYYDGYVIWGHITTDSLNRHHTGIGFGKFEMNGNNKVKEFISVSTYSQIRGNEFDLDIEMNGPDEYTQTIHYPDSSRSVEIYKRLKKE